MVKYQLTYCFKPLIYLNDNLEKEKEFFCLMTFCSNRIPQVFKVYRRQTKRFCAWMANTLHDEYTSSSFFVLSNQFIFLDYQASQLCVSCVKSTCCSQYGHLNTLYKLCTFAFQEYHFIINIALSQFYLLKDFFVVRFISFSL